MYKGHVPGQDGTKAQKTLYLLKGLLCILYLEDWQHVDHPELPGLITLFPLSWQARQSSPSPLAQQLQGAPLAGPSCPAVQKVTLY